MWIWIQGQKECGSAQICYRSKLQNLHIVSLIDIVQIWGYFEHLIHNHYFNSFFWFFLSFLAGTKLGEFLRGCLGSKLAHSLSDHLACFREMLEIDLSPPPPTGCLPGPSLSSPLLLYSPFFPTTCTLHTYCILHTCRRYM